MEIQCPRKAVEDRVFTRVFDPQTGEAWIFVPEEVLELVGSSGKFAHCPKIERSSVCLPEDREFAEFSAAFRSAFGRAPNVATIYGGNGYVSKIRKAATDG